MRLWMAALSRATESGGGCLIGARPQWLCWSRTQATWPPVMLTTVLKPGRSTFTACRRSTVPAPGRSRFQRRSWLGQRPQTRRFRRATRRSRRRTHQSRLQARFHRRRTRQFRRATRLSRRLIRPCLQRTRRSPNRPGAHPILTAAQSGDSVSLSWSAPGDGGQVTGYRIWRRLPDKGERDLTGAGE